MKFRRTALLVAPVSLLLLVVPAGAVSTAPQWHAAKVISLPSGATGLPNGFLPALSCPSAGNCTAAGTYYTNLSASPSTQNVFVASEVGGNWWAARVPAGLLALNTAGYASVAGLGCAAAANCVVGGDYDAAAGQGAFLLAEIPWRG